ncbi:thioredoxin family protein [Peribacillus sp. SCS-26]|uniref:thioredoxin family protein n=1 Tax=Paraperibacillus marinus TaxID=3115295 RepID=UPI0039069776
MKKVIIFLIIIIALFGAMALVNNMQQKEKTADTPKASDTQKGPYGGKELNAATTGQLEDPNYQNIILPDTLKTKLDKKEDVTVYFFSPLCPHCKEATPRLMPLAEDKGIQVEQFNLLEFEDGWDAYNIESTPTLVQFKDGKETARIVGAQDTKIFSSWFDKNTLK